MDLRQLPEEPTPAERAAVDAVIGDTGVPRAFREARGHRHLLLPVLHGIAERIGWISRGALGYACSRLHVPPAEAYGVASFYALFSLSERPRTQLHVCTDLACHLNGAQTIVDELTTRLGPPSTAQADAMWLASPCLGLCERAPAALLTSAGEAPKATARGPVDATSCMEAIAERAFAPMGDADLPQRRLAGTWPERLLARVGRVRPESLEAYLDHGGYQALPRALAMGSAAVIQTITEAGLVGRGGAAFPTGKKWSAVAAAHGTKYVVCNADESEPGTFKDRVLLEGDPFAILEAMTIAGVTVGAAQGFIYLRGEYPLARRRVEAALAAARAAGWLGPNIGGSGRAFDIELRLGAGAYICGEETALFASLEGFRGEPRTKPPFPVEVGLFGRPTVVNNVETLANVPPIVMNGALAYRSLGTNDSPGTRLFCVSGNVAKPGVYELAHGTPLRELLQAAGAPSPRTVLLGGAAGTFIGAEQFDLPLSFEATRATGTTLGSGVVLVIDDAADIGALLARIAHFFRDESCGQCVPCRVGTQQQDALVALLRREPSAWPKHAALYGELSQAMRDASICGLGQTATSAIESALRLGLHSGDA